ncbi:DNA repair protein RadA [Acetoanaerobium noterae]|jgi:DNA repair protein RadA/Sms|uniref:DNA repair protein RadA n=1 Tax=Acetoanaerobium noterae TaxID=745369 RepID=UPI001B5D49DA|nr:DNA repair protein RadA [Acetoanaerobium noterae]MBP8763524.1 DNA repair protein RadA [Acetoanaerobium sp.]MBP9500224.1 DNA repair protein RadA [Acetoanaerobium sp.]MBP9562701.1 DNA repair protein RadA [Acetoanaerobium sp.]
MAKVKTKYICQQCGYESAKWWGICPECNSGGSMVEEAYTQKETARAKKQSSHLQKSVDLKSVEGTEADRFTTHISEFDRVLGGGIVRGSLVLIGGDPGIGKSTLLLQLAHHISKEKKVLYISGEESAQQIKLRASRLFSGDMNMLILAETNLDTIEGEILAVMPDVVVIDSVQTVSSPELTSLPGSVSQVREATGRLMNIAKANNISCFLVGHVTKEGAIAGPRVLEHLVDTVLYFEGERFNTYRMIRAVKNRFGSTNELGVFEMTDKGLIEVSNPSKILLSEHSVGAPGTAIVCTMEGTRPMLVEIQALVAPTTFAVPRRTATGIDFNRLNMLLAVLERRAGLRIQSQDVYVNLTGGIKIYEPSLDLGIACAVASSFSNREIKNNVAFFGEIGLTGEIRSVSFGEKRINEALKLGFEEVIVPYSTAKDLKNINSIKVTGVKDVKMALAEAFK